MDTILREIICNMHFFFFRLYYHINCVCFLFVCFFKLLLFNLANNMERQRQKNFLQSKRGMVGVGGKDGWCVSVLQTTSP